MKRIASRGGRRPRPPHSLQTGVRLRTLVLLSWTALTLGAVGLAHAQSGGSGLKQAPAAAPACARAGAAIKRPGAVPAELLPRGTVLTSTRRSGRGTLVFGVVPREFRQAVTFFVTKLPVAGYRNLSGDAEMDEAEAFFAGDGVRGKWRVNGIPSCPRAVTLALYVVH